MVWCRKRAIYRRRGWSARQPRLFGLDGNLSGSQRLAGNQAGGVHGQRAVQPTHAAHGPGYFFGPLPGQQIIREARQRPDALVVLHRYQVRRQPFLVASSISTAAVMSASATCSAGADGTTG